MKDKRLGTFGAWALLKKFFEPFIHGRKMILSCMNTAFAQHHVPIKKKVGR